MLYEVGKQKDRYINPKKVEQSLLIQNLKSSLDPRTLNKMCRTLDDAVDNIISEASNGNKFVWTRMGAIAGHKSRSAVADINHLWQHVDHTVNDGKLSLLTIGTLLCWRIALREEKWLVYRRETGEWDHDENKEITISEYWINENYVPPKTHFSLNDLKNKFNPAVSV